MSDESEHDARGERPEPDRKAPEDAGKTPGTNVRPAGPEDMKMPPRRWTKVDEEGDESFPASDPPGNY